MQCNPTAHDPEIQASSIGVVWVAVSSAVLVRGSVCDRSFRIYYYCCVRTFRLRRVGGLVERSGVRRIRERTEAGTGEARGRGRGRGRWPPAIGCRISASLPQCLSASVLCLDLARTLNAHAAVSGTRVTDTLDGRREMESLASHSSPSPSYSYSPPSIDIMKSMIALALR